MKQNILNRENYLDVARGIALFFVVLGHLATSRGAVFTWVFSFHMMLFFFISGYVFNPKKYEKYKFTEYFDKKVKTILVPFAIVVIIGFIVCLIIPSWRQSALNINDLLYLAQPENLHVGQIWFLVCLFWTEILFFALYKVVFRKVSIATVIFITILISVIGFNINAVSFLSFSRLPWKLDSAITALVFYTAGYYIKKLGLFNKLFNHKVLSAILMIAFLGLGYYISIYKNGYVNIGDCQYGEYLYFYAAAFCGIAFIMLLSKFIEKVRGLQYYGRNTLWMFALHSFLLYLSIYILNKITLKHYVIMNNIPLTYCLIMAVLIYLALGLVPYVIRYSRKLKDKFLLAYNKF